MTINPSTQGADAYDLLDGSVSSFYAAVDEAIAASEVVKGQYRMTINPAYNAPNPVDSNSFTTVGLTQSGPMVVDLENSYITTEVELTLRLNTPLTKPETKSDNNFQALFVGWKSSVEAIERYDIMVNSTPIYTQSYTGEESFVQYHVINDLVKNTSPFIYTTYKNAAEMSPNVCGAYITFSGDTAVETITGVKIPIKIPCTNFLILRNLKYLLSWMGKWEIRLYFSPQNLVVLPIEPSVIAAVTGVDVTNSVTTMTHNFTQHMDEFDWVAGDYAAGKNRVECTKMTLNNVEMNTAQFQIRLDILEMLKQKYLSEKPLTFPVSTIQISRFTGPPEMAKTEGATVTDNAPLSIVLSQAINNCDTLFILPYRNAFQHTVCTNPYVKGLQLHAGEYGSYPTQPFDTYSDLQLQNIRFVNAAADALNVNSSALCSFSEDIARSFVPSAIQFYSTKTGATSYKNGPGGHWGDRTNFFIPFPFSTDDDFQGGLSSPSNNINFKLTGTFKPYAGIGTETCVIDNRKFDTPWVAAFLIDGVIMVRPDPGSDAAKVIWSDRTVC